MRENTSSEINHVVGVESTEFQSALRVSRREMNLTSVSNCGGENGGHNKGEKDMERIPRTVSRLGWVFVFIS